MTEDRSHREDDAFPRCGLKALCVVVTVLALVGAILSGLVCFSDDIMRGFHRDSGRGNGEEQRIRLRHALERSGPDELARRLLREALGRTDPEPFIAAKPWATLRLSMGLRLVSYGLLLLGSIMVFMGWRLGLRLMIAVCFVLVLHGVVEALSLLQHGQFLVAEYYRDLRVNYLDLVDSLGLSDSIRDPLSRFSRQSAGMLRALDVLYFVVMTLLWQLALVCLVWWHARDRASWGTDDFQESQP